MKPIIELVDVSAGYKDHPVFTHLSLTIEAGKFCGIVGPTGSGKTTLLKAILGSHRPHGGTVLIDGLPVDKVRPGTIGYVPQLETVDWTFPVTVEQVILMGLYTNRSLWPWPTREERRAVRALAEKLGILPCLNNHIRDISGGQQQRAFLARALVNNPRLLVLDEPTSGVDIKTQHDVLHLLGDLNAEGITIILTSHDLNAVAAHLPWVICFNKAMIAQGPPRQVFNNDVLSRTYGGELVIVEHEGHLLVAHSMPMGDHQARPPARRLAF